MSIYRNTVMYDRRLSPLPSNFPSLLYYSVVKGFSATASFVTEVEDAFLDTYAIARAMVA